MKNKLLLAFALFVIIFTATTAGVLAASKISLVVDGKPVENVEFKIIDGRTYLPLRSVAMLFGVPVNWDEGTKTISFNTVKTDPVTKQNSVEDAIEAAIKATTGENGKIKPKPESNTIGAKIETTEDLKRYLENNYSELNTSIGKTKFTFGILENNQTFFPEDYSIEVRYDSTFFFDLTYSNKLTKDQKEKVKEELKEHQEMLAKAVINTMPNKKIKGSYHDSWWKYPNLKMDLQTRDYYSWSNFDEPSYLDQNFSDTYEIAKPSTFRWTPEKDDKL